MKGKIIFGLAIFALMFFFDGIYIITTMENAIYKLRLHGRCSDRRRSTRR